MLTFLKREKHTKNKKEYVDRGVGSLLDGYCTSDDLVAISRTSYRPNADVSISLCTFLCMFNLRTWKFLADFMHVRVPTARAYT
jgi:hypothetical protein